jgi:hypothetical protein
MVPPRFGLFQIIFVKVIYPISTYGTYYTEYTRKIV